MDYIKAIVDNEEASIIGFHCDVCFGQIDQINEDFENVDIEEFSKDGFYILKVIHHEAEYLNGGLANGAWNDFKVIDYKPFAS